MLYSRLPEPTSQRTKGRLRTPASAEVTELLLAWRAGDERALDQLLPVVYRELHRMARRYMAAESPGPHASGFGARQRSIPEDWWMSGRWSGRIARTSSAWPLQLMRRILVDFGRRRHYLKRGGGVRPVTLNEDLDMAAAQTTNLVALDDALNALGEVDPRRVRVVELRFFAGLTVEETAEVLKVSPDTVVRDWRLAKVWLHRELKKGATA